MDWKDLSGSLIGSGAPILGKIIGGLLPVPGGAFIGEAAGNMLAKALGVEATPQAVSDALHNDASDITLAKIKAAEAEAVAKWPALAEMAKAQHEAETAQFQAQIDDTKSARTRDVAVRNLSGGTNNRANVMLIGAFVCLVAVIVGVLWFRETIPDGIAAILQTACGSLLTLLGQAFNFEFGSSRSSAEKSDQITTMLTTATALNGSLNSTGR